jgi:hypothetical protein
MKATLRLANGTKVEIDGEPDEVRRLLADFSGVPEPRPPGILPPGKRPTAKSRSVEPINEVEGITELAVVNRIKEDEALQWTHPILDSRDMTLRILLPLYVASEIDPGAEGITSGFISRVYAELGIRMNVGNTSTELSGRSKKFVLADIVRRKGAPVHYKISRAGRAFFEQSRNG